MSRKKSYSSELTQLIDFSTMLSRRLFNFREELSKLMADSDKLKELEPVLKDIRRAASIVDTSPADSPPAELPPDDSPPDEPFPADAPTAESPPTVRHRRMKKVIAHDTPPE